MKRKNNSRRKKKFRRYQESEIIHGKPDGEDIVPIYNFLSIIIGIWSFLYPIPYELSMIVSMIAASTGFIIMFIYNESVAFFTEDSSPNFVGIGIALNSIAILFNGSLSSNTVYSTLFWIYFALCCIILIILMILLKKDALKYIPAVIILVITITAYSMGMIINTNYLFDNSEPTVYSTCILEKHAFKDYDYKMGVITTYDITLAPWGNFNKNITAHVSKDFYDTVDNNEEVQVCLEPGILGIEWYYVGT